jgi:molecular chaperone GrpE
MAAENTEIDQKIRCNDWEQCNAERSCCWRIDRAINGRLNAKKKDKFLRLFAEFENYKRRTTKERIELFKTANQEFY